MEITPRDFSQPPLGDPTHREHQTTPHLSYMKFVSDLHFDIVSLSTVLIELCFLWKRSFLVTQQVIPLSISYLYYKVQLFGGACRRGPSSSDFITFPEKLMCQHSPFNQNLWIKLIFVSVTWIYIIIWCYVNKWLKLLCSVHIHKHNEINVRGQHYLQATENAVSPWDSEYLPLYLGKSGKQHSNWLA